MSLKVWLPLTGDLLNRGLDDYKINLASGNTWETTGKIGPKSLKLTAQQKILPQTSCMTGAKQVSYAFWVKVNTVWTTEWLDGIHWRTVNSGGTVAHNRQEFYTNCTRIGTFYPGGSLSGEVFTPGVWTHLAGTFDYNTGATKFYINGHLVLSGNDLDTDHTCRGDFYIGDGGVNICENDVRIYDHCLSDAEVREIAQGLVVHYKLNDSIGFTDLIARDIKPTIYNNHNNTNMPSTLVNTGNRYNGDIVWRETCTPTDNSLNSIKVSLASHGIYDWRRTYSANTKYVFWIYYKPISHPDTRCGGVASNIGGWTEIPPVEVGDGWYRVGQYRNGTVTTDKTDNVFVSFKVPSATTGTPIVIDWASPHLLAGTTEIPRYDYPASAIEDSSGYNNHGSLLGTATISSDTPRYDSSLTLPSGSNAINCGRGGMVTDSITVNLWLKATAWGNPVSCTESGGWNFEASGDYFRFVVNISGVGYKYGASATTKAELCNDQWHMLTGVYDRINQKVQIYVDGQLDDEVSSSSSNVIKYHASNVIWIGAEASSSATAYASRQMVGSFSDFRIYATALSASDILQLYHTGAKIDNQANLHIYEINENGANKLTKTGILYDNMIESIKVLPDESYWQLLLFHYVDNGNNLFTSSNATDCNDFGLYSRLKDIDNFTYNGKYEFYVIQDDKEFRWTQTNRPTASSISGLTTVSGYTNPVNGLAKANQSSTYIGYGAWWGACGSWTKFSTGGKTGIPGFGAHNGNGVCTQYLALYARIEKPDVKLSNQTANSSEFIEL